MKRNRKRKKPPPPQPSLDPSPPPSLRARAWSVISRLGKVGLLLITIGVVLLAYLAVTTLRKDVPITPRNSLEPTDQTHDQSNAHPGPKELGSESGERSPALQNLLREAQSGSSVPIRIETYTPDPSKPAAFQGQTWYRADKIEINVASGVSKSYDEALLAHELFHVVLHNKGFNPGVTLARGYVIPGLTAPDTNRFLAPIGTGVNSCFPDELIDRETAKRGFKPALLTDLQAEETLAGLKKSADQRIPVSDPLAQRGNAVNLFCLGLRRPSSIQAIDKVADAWSPEIAKKERALRRQFAGSRCHFDDPKGCYALTVRLRDAAGFKGMIALKNPSTSNLE